MSPEANAVEYALWLMLTPAQRRELTEREEREARESA